MLVPRRIAWPCMPLPAVGRLHPVCGLLFLTDCRARVCRAARAYSCRSIRTCFLARQARIASWRIIRRAKAKRVPRSLGEEAAVASFRITEYVPKTFLQTCLRSRFDGFIDFKIFVRADLSACLEKFQVFSSSTDMHGSSANFRLPHASAPIYGPLPSTLHGWKRVCCPSLHPLPLPCKKKKLKIFVSQLFLRRDRHDAAEPGH